MDGWHPMLPSEPPADPEEWTDDQWLDWLKATDTDAPSERDASPVTSMGRMVHTAGGQLLGRAMMGMADAIYGPKDEDVVIVAEGDSQPDPDQPITVHLDPDHPARSFVVFRPDSDPTT
jgi:hypothetical protein